MKKYKSAATRKAFLKWCFASGHCHRDPTKHYAQFSVESVVSEHLQGADKELYEALKKQPYRVQKQYERDFDDIFYEPGTFENKVLKAVGFNGVHPGPLYIGEWNGQNNPSRQMAVPIHYVTKDGKKYISDEDKAKLDLAAAIYGKALKQDGVGYHKAIFQDGDKDNALLVNVGRPMTLQEIKSLSHAVHTDKRTKNISDINMLDDMNGKGVKYIFFDTPEDKLDDHREKVQSVISDTLKKFSTLNGKKVEIGSFRTDGNLITNYDSFSYDPENYDKIINNLSKKVKYVKSKNSTAETPEESSNLFRRLTDELTTAAEQKRKKWLKKLKEKK